MARYRRDVCEVNPHDKEQRVFYTRWMGRKTLAAVDGCIVKLQGRGASSITTKARRLVEVTAYPDTYFTQPARCSLFGKKVKGYLTVTDGVYYFTPEF